jgi:imidazolonepropionase-like amidohydrolase
MRAPALHVACSCDYSGSLSVVADGVDMVRSAAREQLRRGATQIKLFVSGGVLSPSDPLWMNQFTDEEIAAAVHEAESRRTYVMAHVSRTEFFDGVGVDFGHVF